MIYVILFRLLETYEISLLHFVKSQESNFALVLFGLDDYHLDFQIFKFPCLIPLISNKVYTVCYIFVCHIIERNRNQAFRLHSMTIFNYSDNFMCLM